MFQVFLLKERRTASCKKHSKYVEQAEIIITEGNLINLPTWSQITEVQLKLTQYISSCGWVN